MRLCLGRVSQDSTGRWNEFSGRYPWDKSCICSGNAAFGGTGAEKQGSDFDAAPNVDHTSERVRQVRTKQGRLIVFCPHCMWPRTSNHSLYAPWGSCSCKLLAC